MNDLNLVQKEILKFIMDMGSVKRDEVKNAFMELRNKLLDISKQPYQKRHFLYLDIVSWLESKISDKPVQEVIKAKFKSRN